MAHQKISDLPNSWIVTKLPDAIDLILGQSPASSDCNSDGHGLPFFQGKTEFGKVYPKVRKYCTAPKKLAEKNDVLLSVRAPVGPTNLATEKCAIGRGLAALRTNSDIDFKYLLFYMRHIEPWLSEQGTGSTFKAVSGVFLKELDFFVSPLPEQKRIVEKLDSLLAQVDTIQQRLNNLPDIIKRFRQSVLAAAVSGKLTEQWRENNKKRSQWENVTLSNITRSISDGDHQAPPKAESGIPFLVISNVRTGNVNFDNVSRWVPESYYDSLKEIRVPKVDDILYTVTGSFGIPVLVKTDEKFCFQRHIAIIKPNKDYTSSEFLYYLLNSDFALRQAEEKATGTAQKTVSLKSLRGFQFNIPQIEEQTEIVRLVEHYFALADTLEKNLVNAKQRVDNLTQSILAKAFRGELVPQDPNDEPADKLLARIKAARLEAEKLEKAAKKAAKASKK